jgi:elongation factor 1-alpha
MSTAAARKPHLNMIVVGHIDNGKSTTMGHFLMDLGLVDERTIASHAAESEKTGKGDTFKYAWVMDNIKDERERGITIDLAFQKFESPKYFFTLIDAPGHRDFIKNMITGASEADCAVLVLSAKEGETDTATAPGGQAREHAFLLRTLGVGQLAVAINKMDDSNFSEAAFKAAKEKAEKLLKSVGYKLENVAIIPVSGWKGDNLVKKSPNMPWWTGKTLYEAFDEFKMPDKPTGKPLRIPVQDVYTITGVGTVPVGRVETGVAKPGMKIVVMPSGAVGEIKSIETHHTEMPSAEPGDNIGFNLRGIEKKDIHRGDVIGTEIGRASCRERV